MAMLYERRDRGDPHEWPHHDNPGDFSVRVAAWDQGRFTALARAPHRR